MPSACRPCRLWLPSCAARDSGYAYTYSPLLSRGKPVLVMRQHKRRHGQRHQKAMIFRGDLRSSDCRPMFACPLAHPATLARATMSELGLCRQSRVAAGGAFPPSGSSFQVLTFLRLGTTKTSQRAPGASQSQLKSFECDLSARCVPVLAVLFCRFLVPMRPCCQTAN